MSSYVVVRMLYVVSRGVYFRFLDVFAGVKKVQILFVDWLLSG